LSFIKGTKVCRNAGVYGNISSRDLILHDSWRVQYVVMFQAVNLLSGEGEELSLQCGPRIQECWEFVHPRSDVLLDSRGLPITNTHNVRSTRLTFHIPHAGILHGLAGYFEAVLYRDVGLSIHPERMDSISKDMLSWFPIFFPFRVRQVVIWCIDLIT
jgi:protein arginine N-methyltransferase 5